MQYDLENFPPKYLNGPKRQHIDDHFEGHSSSSTHVQKPYLTMVVNIHIVVGIDQATTGQQEGEARVRGQRRLRPPVRLWLAGVRQSAQQQPHQAQLWRGRRSWLLFWS